MFWYLKKTWQDPVPDVSEVRIHYAWGPRGAPPHWDRFRQVRTMSTQAERIEGKGRVSPHEGRGETKTVWPLPPGVREKIIKVPEGYTNGQYGINSDTFMFYHFFEAQVNGQTHYSDVYAEEIVSWEVEYTDWTGTVLAVCAHWGIGDIDTMMYTPTEEPRFIEWYGHDSEFRSFRIYDYQNLLRFAGEKWRMLQPIPLPRKFRGRLWAPRGAHIIQGWHVVHCYRTPERWPLNDSEEVYQGYGTYTAGG